MKRTLRNLRFRIVSMLLNEEEQYLLKRAIQDRTDKLYELAVTDPDMDYQDCKHDICTLWAISSMLKKTDWK